jgi:hypothetical protein
VALPSPDAASAAADNDDTNADPVTEMQLNARTTGPYRRWTPAEDVKLMLVRLHSIKTSINGMSRTSSLWIICSLVLRLHSFKTGIALGHFSTLPVAPNARPTPTTAPTQTPMTTPPSSPDPVQVINIDAVRAPVLNATAIATFAADGDYCCYPTCANCCYSGLVKMSGRTKGYPSATKTLRMYIMEVRLTRNVLQNGR